MKTNKGLIALAVLGGLIAFKVFKKGKSGYCAKLGERIDERLESLACKADELMHHFGKG